VHYLIVGTGPDEPRLRGLAAELGIGAAVTFAGYVSEDRLPDLYNLCDLFVMPNREEAGGDIEGFGMIFLEASAAGKPVVGGRSGGTADAIVHGVTGFLVDPEDVDELAATLQLLLANADLRETLGRAGRHRARSEFGWGSRAAMLREVSRAVVDRARRGVAPAAARTR
jgi:phosphatidylinositol alpha-1,6-mannosyltransferase